MQYIQYMTLGMGDFYLRMGVDARGGLTCRPVSPHDIYTESTHETPDRPVRLWELVLRYWTAQEKWLYCWDVYDLGDEEAAEPASYSIWSADQAGGLDEDLSGVFLVHPDGVTTGALSGDSYPWRRSDGSARLPFIAYHAVDTGKAWNEHDKRGVHRGTLNTALFWTYASHCARDATGSTVLVAGLDPIGVDTHTPELGGRGIRTITMTPGAMIYHSLQEGVTPMVETIGAGVNLPDVAGFAVQYEQRQAIRYGLNPADAERQAANPMSGISMFLSRQEKREFSEQVEPLFRRSDLDALELASIVLRAAGSGDYDESGYTVVYPEIPRSPSEEKERRDRLQWELDQGMISTVEMYQRLNPGSSPDDATAALVDAQVSDANVSALTAAALEAAGLTTAEPIPGDLNE
jgi:hypothetical protein